MRRLLISCICISYYFNVHAQDNIAIGTDTPEAQRTELDFSLKTDIFSVLNSILSEGMTEVVMMGEVCFDKKYSVQLNAILSMTQSANENTSGFRMDWEFRQYILKDYCSCSALHAGVYVGFENINSIKQRRMISNSYIRYTESIFETGVAGGYKAVIANRWTVDPTVYAGFSNIYRMKVLESSNYYHDIRPASIMVKIVLAIGCCF